VTHAQALRLRQPRTRPTTGRLAESKAQTPEARKSLVVAGRQSRLAGRKTRQLKTKKTMFNWYVYVQRNHVQMRL